MIKNFNIKKYLHNQIDRFEKYLDNLDDKNSSNVSVDLSNKLSKTYSPYLLISSNQVPKIDDYITPKGGERLGSPENFIGKIVSLDSINDELKFKITDEADSTFIWNKIYTIKLSRFNDNLFVITYKTNYGQ